MKNFLLNVSMLKRFIYCYHAQFVAWQGDSLYRTLCVVGICDFVVLDCCQLVFVTFESIHVDDLLSKVVACWLLFKTRFDRLFFGNDVNNVTEWIPHLRTMWKWIDLDWKYLWPSLSSLDSCLLGHLFQS